MEKNTVLVSNRGAASIGYVSYQGQPRYFQPAGRPGDTLPISTEEIKQLSYSKGGRILLEKYLYIQDEEVVEATIGEQEPEYSWGVEDVIKVLKSGEIEELEDALEFAPEGVIDLIKSQAVEMRLDSSAKRSLIRAKTGFNVDQAIKNAIEAAENDKASTSASTKPARRARNKAEETEKPARRASAKKA